MDAITVSMESIVKTESEVVGSSDNYPLFAFKQDKKMEVGTPKYGGNNSENWNTTEQLKTPQPFDFIPVKEEPREDENENCDVADEAAAAAEAEEEWNDSGGERTTPVSEPEDFNGDMIGGEGEEEEKEEDADAGATESGGNGEGRYQCRDCGRRFARKDSLDYHLRAHAGERPFQCSACPKAFRQRGALVEHERVHTGERPFACAYCPRAFAQSSRRLQHERENHTAPAARPSFPCALCGKAFGRRSSLARHMLAHTGERPYHCPLCSKSFTWLGSLTVHARTHTPDDRPFACEHCGRAFAHRGARDNHARTHTGEKPFACAECGARFTQAGHLRQHASTHAPRAARAFACERCGKRFARKSELATHARTHTGEKPFRCPHCPKAFAAASNLSTHSRKHAAPGGAGARPPPPPRTLRCAHCPRLFARPSDLHRHAVKAHPDPDGVHDQALAQVRIDDSEPLEAVGLKRKQAEIPNGETVAAEGELFTSGRVQTDEPEVESRRKVRVVDNLQCPLCPRVFARRGNLQRHVSKAHPDPDPSGQPNVETDGVEAGAPPQADVLEAVGIRRKMVVESGNVEAVETKELVNAEDVETDEPEVIELVELSTQESDILTLRCPCCRRLFTRLHDLRHHVAEAHPKRDPRDEANAETDEAVDGEEPEHLEAVGTKSKLAIKTQNVETEGQEVELSNSKDVETDEPEVVDTGEMKTELSARADVQTVQLNRKLCDSVDVEIVGSKGKLIKEECEAKGELSSKAEDLNTIDSERKLSANIGQLCENEDTVIAERKHPTSVDEEFKSQERQMDAELSNSRGHI